MEIKDRDKKMCWGLGKQEDWKMMTDNEIF